MTDTPPSWQDDPTGRHDHRYWDGTQWTEHVADAGVAGTDPYDGPATAPATAEAEAPATPDPEPTTAAPSAGWVLPAADPVAEPAAEPAAPEEPAPLTWSPAPTTPAAPTTGWGVPAEPEPEPDPVPADEPTRSTVSGWGAPTELTPIPDVEPSPAAEPTTQAYPAFTTESTATTPDPDPVVAPHPQAPQRADGGGEGPRPDAAARRPLVLALAALAVIGLIVAILAITGGDDDDKGPDAITTGIVSALQADGHALSGTSDDDARCVAEHIVDEVGADRLEGVDFSESELPDELDDDVAAALVTAIDDCNVDVEGDAEPGGDDDGDPSTDATDPGSTGDTPSSDIDLGNPDDLERLLIESFVNTQQLERGKAECLAKALTDAIRDGETSADNPFSDPDGYLRYLEECGITEAEVGLAQPS